MIRRCLLALAVTLGCASGDRAPGDDPTVGGTLGLVERVAPDLDAIVAPDAVFEVLADGHEWTEGPVWVPSMNALLYSDVPRNAIYRWTPDVGSVVWLTPSGYTDTIPRGGEPGSNGLALDAHDRLVIAQHGDRRIARLEAPLDAPAPDFITISGDFDGGRYNSPNDLAMHSDGSVYFTDPPYGLEQGESDPAKDLPTQGVYRVAPDGAATLLVDDLSRPNGIAFSPDEQTLYVANSDPDQAVIMAYDVRDDGGIANGRVLFDSWGDGMAVDTAGTLYVTDGRRGILVLTPDGTHLGTLVTGERTSNCTFGDDGSTLYATADAYLVRIRLRTKGVGF
jgi:gluconolactonase